MFTVAVLIAAAAAYGVQACSPSGSRGGCGGGCRARAMAAGRLDVDGSLPRDYVYGLGVWTDADPFRNASYPQLTNPNHLFKSCCEERGLPRACASRCHFATYNNELLTAIITGVDACPLSSLPEMQFCAAQGRDHSQCCQRRGVSNTLAGDKCLVFCDQTPDKIVPVDYTYLPCFAGFETMKQCFYQQVERDARQHFGRFLH